MDIKNLKKFSTKFYLQDVLTVAKNLVGQYLIRNIKNKTLVMQITETEAYSGYTNDKACHAHNKKRTERTKVLFEQGGVSYVYLIYGMYYCFNIVTEKKDYPSAVLIRAGIPVYNIDEISFIRYNKPFKDLSKYQVKNFANGPGKLCKCLDITKKQNNINVCGNEIYVCKNKDFNHDNIKAGKRINIDYAKEAKDFLWRFYF